MADLISELPGTPAATPTPTPTPTATPTAAPSQPPPLTFPYYSPAPGQPFEPYTGDFSEKDFLPPVNAKWERTKIVLHSLGILFAVAGFAISGAVLGDRHMPWEYRFTIMLNYAPLAPTLLWDAAELITRAARKWKAGIHPGAHVALSLILWLICLFFAFTVSGLELPRQTIQDDCGWLQRNGQSSSSSSPSASSSSSSSSSSSPSWEYKQCVDSSNKMHSYGTAMAFFILLCGIVHFILFVGACVDTNRRNRAAKRPRVIMVAHPQLAIQGWQPLPTGGVAVPNELPVGNAPAEKGASGTFTGFYAPVHSPV